MKKITFLGDLLCEAPFLRAALSNGKYDFDRTFSGLYEKCRESDCLIANLETPVAGADMGLVDDRFTMYSMNAPIEFAKAIKNLGVDLVLTGNNHCCDRRIPGLLRTLDALDSIGLQHTGTYRDHTEPRNAYLDLCGVRIGVISYTASTNENLTGVELTSEHVNILKTQRKTREINSARDVLSTITSLVLSRIVGSTRTLLFKKKLGLKYKEPITDNAIDKDDVEHHLQSLKEAVKEARTNADLVFVCPHMGGQFNLSPGIFSEYIMERITDFGVDAVVASHPHIVQKCDFKNGVPSFFSIGNVTMSLSTNYIISDDLPDYGLMVHFYAEDDKIKKTTFSIIKITEDENGYISVNPLFDLFNNASDHEKTFLLRCANTIASRVTKYEYDYPLVLDEYPISDSKV